MPATYKQPAPGDLCSREPHPSAQLALDWIRSQTIADLCKWREAFASCAIEGNRLGEICGETLNRIEEGKPVSDRYVLGLAWAMRFGEVRLPRPKRDWSEPCECRKCLNDSDEKVCVWPVEMLRFIACPTCGNKRCPHASDHALACTDSNEPGQVGSVYE